MRTRAAASVAALVALVEGAAASSGHYDSGHLAVFAVVGGAVAIGSSALGGQLGSAAKRAGAMTAEPDGTAPAPRPAPARAESAAPGTDATRKAAVAAADYAAKVIADGSPSGEAMRGAYDVAKGAFTDPSVASGAAEGIAKAATDQLKAAVKAGATEGAAAPGPAAATPAIGTLPKFCRDCGTPTREGARYCASCGRKLV
jgi:hypothetical protein